MTRQQQLLLPIGLRDSATFDNFLPGENQAACHALTSRAQPFVYLWGEAGTGKTHLMQAACHQEEVCGGRAIWLPLAEMVQHDPALLDGLEQMSLVCLDDLQVLCGEAAWQQAVFHLYNRIRDAGQRMLAAGDNTPGCLGLDLADLSSRISWGPVYQLQPISDADKIQAMCLRAEQRGMSMPQEVASYLLNHGPRDMHRLFALLEQLDKHSLLEQRRLTIPFVRQLVP